MTLYESSYDILKDRITDRGYAVTSLTGAYVGMFTRDSSIQAMAHISNGDLEAARKILYYLLSSHAELGLRYATHIVDDLREEECRGDYLGAKNGEDAESGVSQRSAEIALYSIVSPNHAAAQPFVPLCGSVAAVEVHLSRSSAADTVKASIRTDYRDPSSTVGEALYTFGQHPDGWQRIVFDRPVPVTPGQTCYLVLETTRAAGNVAWNGTLNSDGKVHSYNYDLPSFGGWVEKPYRPAFEILPCLSDVYSMRFTARGAVIDGAGLELFAEKAGGKVRAEIMTDRDDPSSVLCTAEAAVERAGEQSVSFLFDGAAVTPGDTYDLVFTFIGCNGARPLTDPSLPAETYALDGARARIGYAFRAQPLYDVDRAPLITLDGQTAGVQEIPAEDAPITTVKVLLSAKEGARGALRAILTKGYGESAQRIGVREIDLSSLSPSPEWIVFPFDLPLQKTRKAGNYYLKLEFSGEGAVCWHGSTSVDRYETFIEKDGASAAVAGEAGFAALKGRIRQISNYMQTDTTYMLIHAWAMFARNSGGTTEDSDFIAASYPIVRTFANFYTDNPRYYNKDLDLLFNPSLEHSRKGRYWQAYDLITNVFASQALWELADTAKSLGDRENAEKWTAVSLKIKEGIEKNLTALIDGKKIYAEFYDKEDGMKFYPGISWVNFAPVAAEWYGMDENIMRDTYEIYKKYAGIKMLGFDGLATDATLGTGEIRRELIGKGVAWELMFCRMIGDEERIKEILALERATAARYHLTVYPESWTSASSVSDPGNQEHCAWQVYAVSVVFPDLRIRGKDRQIDK